jgi:hypothetical protein
VPIQRRTETPVPDVNGTPAEGRSLRLVTGTEDAVIRRQRFEEAHPDAVILPPAAGRWRAVFAGRTLGSWDLAGLMDELETDAAPDPGLDTTGTREPLVTGCAQDVNRAGC